MTKLVPSNSLLHEPEIAALKVAAATVRNVMVRDEHVGGSAMLVYGKYPHRRVLVAGLSRAYANSLLERLDGEAKGGA